MTEIEVPLEKVSEDIQHTALHGAPEGAEPHVSHGHSGLVTWGALLSACFAVLAAIAALLAGHHANEAMIDQLHASDSWGYYQAKGIKAAIVDTRRELLAAIGKPVPESHEEKFEEYKKQQQEIQAEAKEHEAASLAHLSRHQTLAKAVTFFQVAIAITAIAVLARRRAFLYVSSTLAAIGAFFLALGLL